MTPEFIYLYCQRLVYFCECLEHLEENNFLDVIEETILWEQLWLDLDSANELWESINTSS